MNVTEGFFVAGGLESTPSGSGLTLTLVDALPESEAWRGVELLDVFVHKKKGYYVVDDISVFAAWMTTPAAELLWPLPRQLHERL